MKNGKRKLSLRAADGVILPARPVSPLSLRGMGQGLASGYHALVDTTSQGMEAVARPFSHPPGYTPAVVGAPAPVAAPQAPAPAAPQLGGVNVEAIQRREAAAGLADGTPFVSPYSLRGIGQSLRGGYDSVVGHTADMMEAAHNHFGTPVGYTPAALPAAVPVAAPAPVGPAPTVGGAVDAIHQHQQDLQNLANGTGMVRGPGGPIDDKVPAKLSPGESVLPADTTAAIGPENVQRLIDETHTPAHLQKRGVPPGGRRGLRLANGVAGLDVTETPFNENDARMFGQQPAGTVPAPQPQVPGVEVNEPFAPRTGAMPQPQVQGMRVSYPVTDPGPGNPNVNRMGPQRPAAPSPVVEPAPAVAAEAAPASRVTNLRNALVGSPQQWTEYGNEIATKAGAALQDTGRIVPSGAAGRFVGKVAGTAARKLGPAGGVYEAYQGAKEGDGGKIALGTADTVATLGLGTPAAPLAATYLAGRGAYEVGKAAVNATDSVPIRDAIGGTINAGLRRFGMGVDDDAYLTDRAAVNTGTRSPVTGATTPRPTAPPPLDHSVLPGGSNIPKVDDSAANPTDQRLGSGMQVPTGDAASDVKFGNQQGSAVQGADGVRKLKTADGRTIYSNVAGDNSGMMSGAKPISDQNSAAADALSARYASAGLRGGLDDTPNLPAGAGLTVPGQGGVPASQYETELAARNASVHSMEEGRGMNANQRRQAALQERTLAQAGNIASQHDATERRGQDVNADVARAGHSVSLRGQDLNFAATTRGQDMTARTSAAMARMEQMNKDRQFQFDAGKHGDEVAKQRFEMRQSAQKDVTEQIANMIPHGPDDKPDTATAARYAVGLNALVAQHQQALSQRAAQGDKGAQAALDDLSKNGLAALDARTVRDFVNGMKAKDLSDQYASAPYNPVGGTGTITDTPPAGVRKTSNGFLGFGGEYSLVDANGRPTGATIPARAVEGDGSFINSRRRTDLRDFLR